MPTFATYLHPETLSTSRPITDDEFHGFSLPYARQVRERLAEVLGNYPQLPLRSADLDLFL